MKRFTALFCALVVLMTIVIIPVAAAEEESVSAYVPQFTDLMNLDYEYEMQAYLNGSLRVTQTMKDPIVQVNSPGYDIHFIWGDKYERCYFNYILFCLQVPARPDKVTFNDIDAVMVGYTPGFYYYKVVFNKTSNSVFDVYVDMGSNTGELKLSSCFGVLDDSVAIEEVNLHTWGQLQEDMQPYMQNFYDGSVIVPYAYEKTFSSDSVSISPSQFFVDINFPMPVPYADSVSLTFSSPNLFPNNFDQDTFNYGGVALVRAGSTDQILPYTLSDVIASGNKYGHVNYIYTVTVDLTGIDLTDNCFIHFRTVLSRKYYDNNSSNQTNFFNINLMNCSYKINIHTKPWYIRFFYWIKNEFTELKNTISSALGLDGDPNLDSEREQAAQDKMEENKESNEVLGGLTDDIGDGPDVPSYGDTGLDGFDDLIQQDILPVKPVFAVLFNNPIVMQMVTYVFMFALGGFLLFGER